MARPIKTGLDYFPLDAGFFGDDRIFELTDRRGTKGICVYIALLTIVYAQGYFIELPPERLAGLIMRTLGTRCFSERAEVAGILADCADIGLIEPELYSRGVVTSAAIQRRYAMVTARRAVSRDKYWLLSGREEQQSAEEDAGVFAAETPVLTAASTVLAGGNPTKKTKENQTKENKTRQDDITDVRMRAEEEPAAARVCINTDGADDDEDDMTAQTAQEYYPDMAITPQEQYGHRELTRCGEVLCDDRTLCPPEGWTEDDATMQIRSALYPHRSVSAPECARLRELCGRYGTEQVLAALRRAAGYNVADMAAYVARMLKNGSCRSAPQTFLSAPSYHSAGMYARSDFGMMRSEYSMDEALALMDEDWISGVSPVEQLMMGTES